MKNEVICLISVENRSFTPELLAGYQGWLRGRGMRLVCCVLDVPERYNIMAFQGLAEIEALALAQERGRQVRARLMEQSKVRFVEWAELVRLFDYGGILLKVVNLFERSGKFRRECLNQTFSKLRPRFRTHGVESKRDPRVSIAVKYLLEEVALKEGLFAAGLFGGEIMPHPESELQLRMYKDGCLRPSSTRDSFLIIWHDGIQAQETVL